MEDRRIWVGTSKGLVEFEIVQGKINYVAAHFQGLNVTSIHQHFDGTIYVAISHKHWGEKLFSKLPISEKWDELNVPKFTPGLTTVKGTPATLKQIWSIHHGGPKNPDRLWIGTEPGALFLSEDRGNSYSLIESLWNHPTRIVNKQWFGAGKDLPFLHSLIVQPNSSNIIYVSVSCAGTFKSIDSGISWECVNNGMKASYLPNSRPEAGYDPHHMIMSTSNNDVLWQQNHCGIFRSDNGGQFWRDVSGTSGYPNYGFAIAIEETSIDEAWVIPVEDETTRVPPGLKLCVLKTDDRGLTWKDASNGLPETAFWGIVLRNGFAKHQSLMAFGTTNGNLYFSDDKGNRWEEITNTLSKVNYLIFSK